jgi:RES domain-containing protein
MRKAAVQWHPRFAEWRDLFRRHPEWFVAWRGTFFRFQTVDFPVPKEILSGEGARQHGGRWNPPGLGALYGSLTESTALAECKANDRYYGVNNRSPRLLVAIEAQLNWVLDLTNPATRRLLKVTLAELGSEDWRKLQNAGKESFTQAIGRAVAVVGGSGLLARSAAIPQGMNVVIFPGAVASDRLEVMDGIKLEALGFRPKA